MLSLLFVLARCRDIFRYLAIVIAVVLVCVVCGPVQAGPIRNLLQNRRLHSRSVSTAVTKTVSVSRPIARTTRLHAHQGQCQIVNGVRVCN